MHHVRGTVYISVGLTQLYSYWQYLLIMMRNSRLSKGVICNEADYKQRASTPISVALVQI